MDRPAPPLPEAEPQGSNWSVRGGGTELTGTPASLLGWLLGRTDGIGLHHGAFLPGRETLRLAAHTLAAGYVAACGSLVETQR